MTIKAGDLIDELELAYKVLKATKEAWPSDRIEAIAQAVENAVGIDAASQIQSGLVRLAAGAEEAQRGAWSASDGLHEARKIVRARQESGFTV